MVQIFRLLTVLSVAALGLAMSVKRTCVPCQDDTKQISIGVTIFSDAVAACPNTGGTSQAVSDISNSISELSAYLISATNDVEKNGALATNDALSVLAAISAFSQNASITLVLIVEKLPSIIAVGLLSPTIGNLQNLKAYVAAFFAALISNCPNAQRGAFISFAATFDLAIGTAISKCSSS
ncbi:hypothetical protein B0H11DRAFT_83048 [Mycena galericulata]|nr:hypothetical protein B0H11DRAFT_83048 [Mycena galericulata]